MKSGFSMIQNVFRILDRKFIVRMVFLIGLQQVLVASGTALTGLAGQSIQSGKFFLFLIFAVLFTSILPQFLKPLVKKLEMQGYWDAYFEFLKLRLFNLTGAAHKWQNQHSKEIFFTAIGPEAETYLTAVAFSIFDIYLFGLTIILNIAALAWIVDGLFLYAFLISGIFSFVLFRILSKKMNESVQLEQQKRIDFSSYILKAWDNVLLNNKPMNSHYRFQIENKFDETRKSIGQSHLRSECLIVILTVASAIPVFGLILWLAFAHSQEAPYLSGLLVTIPKQLLVLTNFRFFFEQITNLSSFQERFKSSWENSVLADTSLRDRIQLDKIFVGGEFYTSLNQLASHVQSLNKGRLTIRGTNGSGKSTLLLHLNKELPDSIYLPSHSHFEIGSEVGSESTGERILKYLDYVTQQSSLVLLLDEWDANLDDANAKMITDRIELISQARLVVEIRHRTDA